MPFKTDILLSGNARENTQSGASASLNANAAPESRSVCLHAISGGVPPSTRARYKPVCTRYTAAPPR